MPQPHNFHVPHLPLILNPSIPSEFGILWIVAGEDQFELLDGFKLASEPIGHFNEDLLKALEQMYTNIVLKIANTSSSSCPSARSDHNVQTYRRRFQYLSGYLKHTVLSYSESLMAWSICQHICLELDARITWVQLVAPIWGKMDAWWVPVVRDVVGALTDNAEVAEKCFWINPPQPIIYTGNVMSLDQYSWMAKNNNKIAFPGSTFDSIDPVTVAPPSEPLSESTKPFTTSGPSRKPVTPNVRQHPYSKQHRPPVKQPHTERNKFEPVISSAMPPSIPAWVKACKQIEHGMLGSMDTKLRQKFLRMYLKLKPLLFYRIQKIGMVESLLSTSLWRKVLGVESLGVTNGTRAAETCQSLIHELQTTLMSSNLTIDLNNLSSVVPIRKKEEIEADILDTISHEILHETITMSFKYELLIADRYLYKLEPDVMQEVIGEGQIQDDLAAPTRAQHLKKILTIPGMVNGNLGFGSSDKVFHQQGIYNLYCIMRTWTLPYGVSSDASTFLGRLTPDKSPTISDIDHAEYLVAYHYVSSFSDYFKRALTVPHGH
ncbi:hypothetical protein GGU10DRAFT_381130 [Lentinula aff. detonsa]|uniref:Uncharacterized protein n=1 Tax=Lentinula aff. detonsa TaxID=2804958 RepID=A0AA38KT51_9AGAR|nr:hypothetical protein GGU10DRAFT_381130 [Lentinula aff. detonsa]